MAFTLSEKPQFVTRPDTWFVFTKVLGNEQAVEAWRTLNHSLGKHNDIIEKTSQFIAVFYTDPITKKMHYEAGLTLSHEAPPREALKCRRLDGGNYASFTLKGPYESIHSAFSQLNSGWVQQNKNLLRNSACLEVYLNDPKITPKEELLTELLIPVQ